MIKIVLIGVCCVDCTAVVDVVNSSVDTQWHKTVPVSFLRQTIPPEIRHEETHLHSHRYVLDLFLYVY